MDEETRQAIEEFRDTHNKLKLTVAEMKAIKYCDSHIAMLEKTEQTHSNTEIIKSRIESLDKRINGSIQDISEHIKESKMYREMVIKHDEAIKSIKGTKTLVTTTLITVILAALGAMAAWGEMHRQVMVNTDRLERLESIEFGK